MAYIGKEPIVGNFQKCDAITTSSTATYNLTVSSVAVFPETTNNCIVSLNGVIQAPTSAYTISGSQIVFASSLTSSDVIDFILILGSVLNVGTVSDGTISTAKVADDAITTAKIADDAITLAKMAPGTDGNLITYDASGNPAAVAAGTAGHFLKSQGAGSVPVFAAAGGGDVVKVGSGSFTSGDPTSVAIDGYFDDSTYNFYKLFAMFQITDGASDTNPHLIQRINIGGSAQTSSYYDWWSMENRINSGSFDVNGRGGVNAAYARAMVSFNATQADASDGNTYWIGEYEFYKPQDTSVNKTWKWHSTISAYHSSGAWASQDLGSCSYQSTAAFSGVTFLWENGQGFEKGYWTMYGYKL